MSDECGWCAGTGYLEVFNESLHDWEDVICEDCGGTGIEDDPEGV